MVLPEQQKDLISRVEALRKHLDIDSRLVELDEEQQKSQRRALLREVASPASHALLRQENEV